MSDESTSRALAVLPRAEPGRLSDLQPLHLDHLTRARLAFTPLNTPVTQSIMSALLQPTNAVLDARSRRRAREAGVCVDADPDDVLPALLGIGEAIVANALMGDGPAATMIAERLEGKVGMRGSELDEATASTRVAVRTAIEAAVRALSEQPGDDATVIDQAPST